MKFRLLILLILLIPISVNAQENVSFECEKKDTNYICDVIGNFNESVNAVDFKISYPSYVKSAKFVLREDLFGSTEDDWVSIIFDEPVFGKVKLGTLTMKSSKLKEEDIKLNDVKIVDFSLEEKELDTNNNVNKKKISKSIIIIAAICGTIIIGIIILMIRLRGVARK